MTLNWRWLRRLAKPIKAARNKFGSGSCRGKSVPGTDVEPSAVLAKLSSALLNSYAARGWKWPL
jgi:hypothetical protein